MVKKRSGRHKACHYNTTLKNMANLEVEIISAKGILYQNNCHMAVVPSKAGDIGILQGHEAVIAGLKEGKVDIFDEQENIIKSFDIKSGFAEMHGPNKLLVLLDS